MVLARGVVFASLVVCSSLSLAEPHDDAWSKIAPYFAPPAEFAGKLGDYRSPLKFEDGSEVRDAKDWPRRRAEILAKWHGLMGPWPALIEKPKVEVSGEESRDGYTEYAVKVEVAPGQMLAGILLVPAGKGPFPAVLVPFYEPGTSVGRPPVAGKGKFGDYGLQLAKRGFVTLSIGSPGGSAWKPDRAGAVCQPLSYLAYIAANCANALANRSDVDAKCIGVVGHSYGGKWAMFASCLSEKFAAAAWSDPGIVFDEARSNVNYWEPWYLGLDPSLPAQRKPGLVTADNPRTGAYKAMVERGMDLHELHALMAPRPFLVSGGSEDGPARWAALNHAIAVNGLLGIEGRVGMTNRKEHTQNAEANEAVYTFFEHFLK
ncbi:MAG: Acetyl xylan esterase [Phycisphaerales bacterium]|nr:Acetyl xylan esterase [Phycisphaerales bacterium]